MKSRLHSRVRALGLRAALLAAGFGAYSTSGCLSNEYRISRDELTRVAQLPPESRGARVRVLQQLGEQQGTPIDPDRPPGVRMMTPMPGDPPPVVVVDDDPTIYVEGHVDFPFPSASPARPVVPASGHWRTPTANPGSGGGGAGKVVSNAGGSVLKGGGGGKGEEVAVLAVVVAVVAMFAVLGLAASEGARFDGHVGMRPEQPLHLKDARGLELHVPLGALTPADAALATEATVRDDEGYGLRLLDRRPIDRVGGTFKVTVGAIMEPPPASAVVQEWDSGMASTIQLGGFPNRRLGILASLSLGGGSDAAGRTFQRHGMGAEVQVFPLLAGPLALGPYAHAGVALAGNSETGLMSGPMVGGGLLLELAMSTRLAFAIRGGVTATNIDGWTSSGSITAGLSIY
jgi:hypothetical protein